jgi:hypothetical protein
MAKHYEPPSGKLDQDTQAALADLIALSRSLAGSEARTRRKVPSVGDLARSRSLPPQREHLDRGTPVHAGTTYGNLSDRRWLAMDGFSPEGTAVPETRDSMTSGALSASVRPLRAAKP